MRAAVLRALLTFLNIQGDGTKGWVDGKILRLIFQNLLVERVEVNLICFPSDNGCLTVSSLYYLCHYKYGWH